MANPDRGTKCCWCGVEFNEGINEWELTLNWDDTADVPLYLKWDANMDYCKFCAPVVPEYNCDDSALDWKANWALQPCTRTNRWDYLHAKIQAEVDTNAILFRFLAELFANRKFACKKH